MNKPEPTSKNRARRRAAAAVVFVSLVALGGTTIYAPSAAASPSGQMQVVTEDRSAAYAGMTAAQLQDAFLANSEVQAALAELESGDGQLSQGSRVLLTGLASKFGLSVLQGVGYGTGEMVFHESIHALGFESSEHAEVMRALAEVQESLNQIQAQNRQIIEAIEALHNEVLKANFKKANADVVTASNNISDIMSVIRIWMENDITPDQATITLTVTALREHTTNLRGAASDSDSGAVPLLLEAYDRNVSDTEQLWEAVEEYRDQVRISLALGIIGLELLIDNWDNPTGEYDASYQTARTTAVDTVDAMYDFGVRPNGPDGQSFMQLKNNVAISKLIEAGDVPAEDRWMWEPGVTTEAVMEPMLQDMVDSYRPANHDGMTLEEFLKSHDLPTNYVYPDSWDKRVTYAKDGLLARKAYYTAEVKLGEISGNTYTTKKVHFGDRFYAYRQTKGLFNGKWETVLDYRDKADVWVANETSEWAKASKGLNSNHTDQWVNESSRHDSSQAWVTFSSESNGVGGFLTDTRPEAIQEAAYGTTQ